MEQTAERIQQRITQLEGLSPEEARAQIGVSPIVMVYEARYALQQVKENLQNLGTDAAFDIVEPLSRAVGWAEALAFAFDSTTQRDALKSLNALAQQHSQ